MYFQFSTIKRFHSLVEGKFLSGFCFKRQLEGRQEDLVVDWILGDDRAHRGSMK